MTGRLRPIVNKIWNKFLLLNLGPAYRENQGWEDRLKMCNYWSAASTIECEINFLFIDRN